MKYKFNQLSIYKLILSICVIWLHTKSFNNNPVTSISGIKNLKDALSLPMTFIGRLAVPTFLILSGFNVLKEKREDLYYLKKVIFLVKLIIAGIIISIISTMLTTISNLSMVNPMHIINLTIARVSKVEANWYLVSYLFILLIIIAFKDFVYKYINTITLVNLLFASITSIAFIFFSNSTPYNFFMVNSQFGVMAPYMFVLGNSLNSKKQTNLIFFVAGIVIIDIIFLTPERDINNYLGSSYPFSMFVAACLFYWIGKLSLNGSSNLNIGRLSTIIYVFHVHAYTNYRISLPQSAYSQYIVVSIYVAISLLIELAFVRRDIKKEA